jgi:hypothetical protein
VIDMGGTSLAPSGTKRIVLLLALAMMTAFLVAASPAAPAEAAVKSDYSLTYCYSSSTYTGQGSNTLTNGTLYAGFCHYAASGVGTATVKYKKTAGNNVTVQLGYEFVNAAGTTSSGRVLDTAFTIKAGETWSYRWNYASPGRYSPSGNTPCVRGVMKVGADYYSTRVVCP